MSTNPVDYVSGNLLGKHIVLLHEDIRYAQLIEFSYLMTNFEREGVCVYLTYQRETLARRQMTKRGLDARHFENEKRLHIRIIDDSSFDFLKTLRQLVLRDGNPRKFRRSRIVWRFDNRRYDKEQLSGHIEEDGKVQSALERRYSNSNPYDFFNNFDGSILCSYPMSGDVLADPHTIRRHLDNHDVVILAPKRGGGAVLQGNGLAKSDMEAWVRNKLEI